MLMEWWEWVRLPQNTLWTVFALVAAVAVWLALVDLFTPKLPDDKHKR